MSTIKRALLSNRSRSKHMKGRPAIQFVNFTTSSSNKLVSAYDETSSYPAKYLNEKYRQIVNFYEEFSGIQGVRRAQEKVEEAGEKLSVIQKERHKAFATLLQIQKELSNVHSELEHTRKGDDLYVTLITKEHNLIKQEESHKEKFKLLDKAERDQFSYFTHALRTSHEKERAHAQRTKYWSIIGSMVGTMIGFIGSQLSNHRKNSELKRLIVESSNLNLKEKMDELLVCSDKVLKNYDNVVNRYQNFHDINNNNNNEKVDKMNEYLDDLLSKTNDLQVNLEKTMKIVEKMSNFKINQLKNQNESKSNLLGTDFETVYFENYNIPKYLRYTFCCLAAVIVIRFLSS